MNMMCSVKSDTWFSICQAMPLNFHTFSLFSQNATLRSHQLATKVTRRSWRMDFWGNPVQKIMLNLGQTLCGFCRNNHCFRMPMFSLCGEFHQSQRKHLPNADRNPFTTFSQSNPGKNRAMGFLALKTPIFFGWNAHQSQMAKTIEQVTGMESSSWVLSWFSPWRIPKMLICHVFFLYTNISITIWTILWRWFI